MTATSIEYQIPRNVLALLMCAQVVVLLPHVPLISPWIVAVCLVCGAWRAMVFAGRWAFPPGWVKAVLVSAAVAGVAASGGGSFSVESASSLLILAFALKLIEMKTRRDAYLVVFLSYFIIATQFLFSQSMLVAFYELGAAVMVTAALIGLNQLPTNVRPWASIRLAGSLLAQALPLTLVLFVFFPRVAPLWSVPLPAGARTGISDSVTPGEIADLSQSDEIAFRVVFDDPAAIPPPAQRYWRGVVYNDYLEGTWTQGRPPRRESPAAIVPERARSGGIGYTVMQEPTFATFLFALATAVPDSPGVELRRTYTLQADQPLMSLQRFDVTSYPAFVRDPQPPLRLPARHLPPGDNPRVRAWARDAFARAGSVPAYIDAVLAEIRREFTYTLQPPLLDNANAIDAFWFDSRAGFCSHFAGAFVYLMRAADIPARMVGGYQGGEINPLTGHLVVRQYDAHAWAEVWQQGSGWQRVDPTFAVAPERIRNGLSAALSSDDRSVLSALTTARLRDFGGFNRMLYLFDSLQHRWNMWVVGYDANTQLDFLTDLLGRRPSPAAIGLAIGVGGAISLLIAGLVLFLRRPAGPRSALPAGVSALLRHGPRSRSGA